MDSIVDMEEGHVSEERMESINAERRFVAATGLVSRRIGEQTILVPITSGVGDLDAIYTLSDVGSRVWALLQSPCSLRA